MNLLLKKTSRQNTSTSSEDFAVRYCLLPRDKVIQPIFISTSIAVIQKMLVSTSIFESTVIGKQSFGNKCESYPYLKRMSYGAEVSVLALICTECVESLLYRT